MSASGIVQSNLAAVLYTRLAGSCSRSFFPNLFLCMQISTHLGTFGVVDFEVGECHDFCSASFFQCDQRNLNNYKDARSKGSYQASRQNTHTHTHTRTHTYYTHYSRKAVAEVRTMQAVTATTPATQTIMIIVMPGHFFCVSVLLAFFVHGYLHAPQHAAVAKCEWSSVAAPVVEMEAVGSSCSSY